MAFDESKHPRDEEGKFADRGEKEKADLQKEGESGKISFARKLGNAIKSIIITPLVFTPTDYTRYKDNQMQKAKRSHERSIEKHLEKIESHQQDPSVPENKKLRLIKHWNAEIRTWQHEIKAIEEEQKRRNDNV